MKKVGYAALAAFAVFGLLGCSKASIDPKHWSCSNLIEPVIEMSQSRDLKILEITNPEELGNYPGYKIECRGGAEWSEGWGNIKYGATVTDGGSVIIQYQQR